MSNISASLVKTLRERTGAGMMECKKALVATDGDIEAAVEEMRKSGLAKADKKAGRVAAEGVISIAEDSQGRAVIAEINCETDFVAGGDDFQAFARDFAELALKAKPADLGAALELPLRGEDTVDAVRRGLVAKLGENIAIRRMQLIEHPQAKIAHYLHGSRIGVVVALDGGDEDLARDIAMHVAASRPVCVAPEDVPAEVVAKEREIVTAQSAESGKPDNIIEKMVEGRMAKYLNEIALVGQPFVKDPDKKVGKLLAESKARVLEFVRFEVGEGIEKKTENFADEVMAQVKGN
ncbi:MAG TPA: translation elongation factor Ts [Gammaproteobacteria bacterium]|nr:translation elongation factor Ts [Gammaproteobacteria bacterium]